MGTKQMLFKKGIILLMLMLPGSGTSLYADWIQAEPPASEVAGKESEESMPQVDGSSRDKDVSLPPTITLYRFEFSYDACGNCSSRVYVPYEPERPPIVDPILDPIEP